MRGFLPYIAVIFAPVLLSSACGAEGETTGAGPSSSATTGVGGSSTPTSTTTTTTGPGTGGSGATGGTTSTGGNGGAGGADTVVLHETFNANTGFTTSVSFFAADNNDYFGISDGNNGGDFGGDSAPSGIPSFMGLDGNFLTAEDLGGDGGPDTVTVDWTGLDVTGLTGLMFSVDLAGSGLPDTVDSINFQFQIDGGGFTKLIEFFGTSSQGAWGEDSDLNGTADSTLLTTTAGNFVKPLLATGASLDVRLVMTITSDNEHIGIDNVRLTGL